MLQVDPGSALSQAIVRAIAQAVLAPSPHNSQPWRFAVRGATVELRADRGRALPVIDPEGRELTISCGAALYQLRAALRAASFDADVARLPEAGDPDLMARLVVRPGPPPSDEESALADAIQWRHTVRAPYLGIELPEDFVARAQEDAAAEGAWLVPLTAESARTELVALVMEADHVQWSDPRFRRELASWMRPNDSAARDGLFGFSEGLDNVESHLAPIAARLLDLGTSRAVHDRDLAQASPFIAILGTAGDGPVDRLRAGEALDRVLLRAESEDVAAAFLNQPVEVDEMRARLGELAGRAGFAQAVIRMGYGPDGRETRRRPLSEMLA